MRQKFVKNQDELLAEFDRYIENPTTYKGNWKEEDKNLLCIEIGMGKGKFISTLAKENMSNKYIGIEICKSVLALATKKILRFEDENNIKLQYLNIIAYDAVKLEEIFGVGEVDKIYLNFSDPWPKNRHEKRRLTSDGFLDVYKNILCEDGEIEFKTDNKKLFEYTILNLNKYGVNMKYISLNLHSENIYNVETEYEEKFSKKGPIYKLVFEFKKTVRN